MPDRCVVVGCAAEIKRDAVKFYAIPASMKDRQEWLKFIGRQDSWTPTSKSFVCSRHFVDGKPTKENPYPIIEPAKVEQNTSNVKEKKRKTEEKVEIQFCSSVDDGEACEIRKPERRALKRKSLETEMASFGLNDNDHCYLGPLATSSQPTTNNISVSYSDSNISGEKFQITSSQPTPILQKYLQKSKRRSINATSCSRLRILALKYISRSKLLASRPKFSWRLIQNSDKNTAYYTFFPSYMTIFRIFDKYIREDAEKLVLENRNNLEDQKKVKRRLKTQDEFLLVMIKLRLNLDNQLLGDMFGLSKSQCGQVLRSWIPFLAKKFGAFVRWTPRDRRTPPPAAFKHYPNCAAIIDCFEIRTQKPSNKRDARTAFSNYKNNETAKILIATSPRGTIMYLSKAWGGRTSDEHIVKENGEFLNNLRSEEKGSMILADKGFRHLKAFLPLQAGVLLTMPVSLKQGQQLSRKETEESRSKSNVRIHVERCIGQLRNFKILKDDFKMSILYKLDDVLLICAGIVNLRPPLVP